MFRKWTDDGPRGPQDGPGGHWDGPRGPQDALIFLDLFRNLTKIQTILITPTQLFDSMRRCRYLSRKSQRIARCVKDLRVQCNRVTNFRLHVWPGGMCGAIGITICDLQLGDFNIETGVCRPPLALAGIQPVHGAVGKYSHDAGGTHCSVQHV